jgi:hypothetical protein
MNKQTVGKRKGLWYRRTKDKLEAVWNALKFLLCVIRTGVRRILEKCKFLLFRHGRKDDVDEPKPTLEAEPEEDMTTKNALPQESEGKTDNTQIQKGRRGTIAIFFILLAMFFGTTIAICYCVTNDQKIAEQIEPETTSGLLQIWLDRESLKQAQSKLPACPKSADAAKIKNLYNEVKCSYNLWIKRNMLKIQGIVMEKGVPYAEIVGIISRIAAEIYTEQGCTSKNMTECATEKITKIAAERVLETKVVEIMARIYKEDFFLQQEDNDLLKNGHNLFRSLLNAIENADSEQKSEACFHQYIKNVFQRICVVGLPVQRAVRENREIKNDDPEIKKALIDLCDYSCFFNFDEPAPDSLLSSLNKPRALLCNSNSIQKLKRNPKTDLNVDVLRQARKEIDKFCATVGSETWLLDYGLRASGGSKSREKIPTLLLNEYANKSGRGRMKKLLLLAELENAIWPDYEDIIIPRDIILTKIPTNP